MLQVHAISVAETSMTNSEEYTVYIQHGVLTPCTTHLRNWTTLGAFIYWIPAPS